MSEKKEFKIGLVGTGRGVVFPTPLREVDGVRLYAICDKSEQRNKAILPSCPPDVKVFTDYDELLDSGIDAVILCNLYTEHASFAIKALNKGIHVLSETIPAPTMGECVELVRTVEKTGCKYMFGENYPYMLQCLEMKRVYEGGTLGRILYGEGEYVHPISADDLYSLTPGLHHWRAWLPCTYYSTHALAPLMMMTDSMPVSVNARAIWGPEVVKGTISHAGDAAAIMLVDTDKGGLFRVTGWAKFAPHSVWYRLGCTKGGIEGVRGDWEKVRLAYREWDTPKGVDTYQTYTAKWAEGTEMAAAASHGGGDFGVILDFAKYLKGEITPFLDVYHAAAMSAVAILGWRSALDGGAPYAIPDFKNEEARVKYENDFLSPFPDENGKVTLPCSSRPYEPSAEDIALSQEAWEKMGMDKCRLK